MQEKTALAFAEICRQAGQIEVKCKVLEEQNKNLTALLARRGPVGKDEVVLINTKSQK